jgi:hypothetical protein
MSQGTRSLTRSRRRAGRSAELLPLPCASDSSTTSTAAPARTQQRPRRVTTGTDTRTGTTSNTRPATRKRLHHRAPCSLQGVQTLVTDNYAVLPDPDSIHCVTDVQIKSTSILQNFGTGMRTDTTVVAVHLCTAEALEDGRGRRVLTQSSPRSQCRASRRQASRQWATPLPA